MSYRARLGLYLTSAVVCSAFGSLLTWIPSSSWVEANPLTAGPMAALSLVPALAIVARCEITGRWLAVATATSGLPMFVLWWLFATSDSSTASFIFFWGWVAGIPAALLITTVCSRLRVARQT